MEELQKQTLTDHLRDLRRVLLYSLAAVLVGFAAAYGVIDTIVAWFLMPLHEALPADTSLVFTSYQEGFFFT